METAEDVVWDFLKLKFDRDPTPKEFGDALKKYIYQQETKAENLAEEEALESHRDHTT